MGARVDGGRKRQGRTQRKPGQGGERLLSQRVFAELERSIIRREHPPGTHLVEEEVAVAMGASRMPVREAFRMLEREGWLEIQPYAGAYVRQPGLNEIRDVFELRHPLGAVAAELASIRATPDQVAELKRLIDASRPAVEQHDIEQLAELNWEFHRALARAAGNALLERAIEDLDKRIRWHFAATLYARAGESWREHEAIVAAVAAQDAALAGRLTFDHSRRSEAAFVRAEYAENDGAEPAAAG